MRYIRGIPRTIHNPIYSPQIVTCSSASDMYRRQEKHKKEKKAHNLSHDDGVSCDKKGCAHGC